MAILDTIGKIWSGGKFVAPHTWFSCVHDDSDSDRTLSDMSDDVNDSIKSIDKDQNYADKVRINTETVGSTEQYIDIASATTTKAGVMSATDKEKLNGVESGAQKNPGLATSSSDGLMSQQSFKAIVELMKKPFVGFLSVISTADDITIGVKSYTGVDLKSTISAATDTKAGVMSASDKERLDMTPDDAIFQDESSWSFDSAKCTFNAYGEETFSIDVPVCYRDEDDYNGGLLGWKDYMNLSNITRQDKIINGNFNDLVYPMVCAVDTGIENGPTHGVHFDGIVEVLSSGNIVIQRVTFNSGGNNWFEYKRYKVGNTWTSWPV